MRYSKCNRNFKFISYFIVFQTPFVILEFISNSSWPSIVVFRFKTNQRNRKQRETIRRYFSILCYIRGLLWKRNSSGAISSRLWSQWSSLCWYLTSARRFENLFIISCIQWMKLSPLYNSNLVMCPEGWGNMKARYLSLAIGYIRESNKFPNMYGMCIKEDLPFEEKLGREGGSYRIKKLLVHEVSVQEYILLAVFQWVSKSWTGLLNGVVFGVWESTSENIIYGFIRRKIT